MPDLEAIRQIHERAEAHSLAQKQIRSDAAIETLIAEIRRLHQAYDSALHRLAEERMRANRAEAQLEALKNRIQRHTVYVKV